MSNYPKYFLPSVFAEKGEYAIPPVDQEIAGGGRLSFRTGWDVETSTPLEQGGIAPQRVDFNGALYVLSQFILWQQQGGLMNYSSSFDYEPGNEVLMNGVKFRCLLENGPSSKKVSPGSDSKYWRNMDNAVPAGLVSAFYKVTLGGSDGRRPIFWGKTEADESWVLCDGGSDGQEGNVPDLSDRFILGTKTIQESGQAGGNSHIQLSIQNIPSHSHVVTIDSNGSHTHTRGNMNITGVFKATDRGSANLSGAFSLINRWGTYYKSGGGDNWGYNGQFDASRSWTGETSSSGSHSHKANCSTVGGNNGSAKEIENLPPYLKLAYFIKLPE